MYINRVKKPYRKTKLLTKLTIHRKHILRISRVILIGLSWIRKGVSLSWRVALSVFAIVGFLAIFWPKVILAPAPTLDPQNPLATPFEIINEGNLPIYDVRYFPNFHFETNPGTGELIIQNPDIIHPIEKISPGDHAPIFLPAKSKPENAIAHIGFTMLVKFRPVEFLPYTFKKYFHFTTSKNAEGEFVWYRQPFTNKTAFGVELNPRNFAE